MKKKLFTFALCIIMVAAIAVPAFAAEPPQWSEGDTTVIDLTYEEFIKKTAELNGISEEEAVQLFEITDNLCPATENHLCRKSRKTA